MWLLSMNLSKGKNEMKVKKISLISFALLFLAGCGPYKVGQDEYLSLDEALTRVRKQYSDSISRLDNDRDYHFYYFSRCGENRLYFQGLQDLWRQAPQEDKEIIEKEMLTFLLKELEIYAQNGGVSVDNWDVLDNLEILKEQTTNEEVRTTIDRKVSEFMEAQREKVKRDREKQEQQERDRVERERAEFEKSRERLIKIANGSLKDKSAQEVKKLLGEWNRQRFLIPEKDKDTFSANFSAETFYKIFGKPVRKQFLSSIGLLMVDSYVFYYDCKDGLVQIRVDAGDLDDSGIVRIIELNIL